MGYAARSGSIREDWPPNFGYKKRAAGEFSRVLAQALIIPASRKWRNAEQSNKLPRSRFRYSIRIHGPLTSCAGAPQNPATRLHRLDRLQRRLEKMIHLPMFGHPSAENRFEVRQIGNINNSIDAVNKRSQGIVGRKEMAEQDNKLLAALGSGFADELLQNWIGRKT